MQKRVVRVALGSMLVVAAIGACTSAPFDPYKGARGDPPAAIADAVDDGESGTDACVAEDGC
jgi:hypothetical protein